MRKIAVLLLICLALPAHADSDDQNRAREAYERHQILPLAKILSSVRKTYGGNVVRIEYEEKNGRRLYEFEIVDDKGRVIEVQYDAATGKRIPDEKEQD